MSKLAFLCAFLLATVALADESRYIGIMTVLDGSKQGNKKKIFIHPISEEPKLVNVRNNLIRIRRAEPFDACSTLQPIPRDIKDSVLLLVDATSLKCSMMFKMQKAKEALVKGFLLITDDMRVLTNHCALLEDSLFFNGVIDSSNATLLGSGEDVMVLLNIHLKDTKKNQVELWVSSLNPASYDLLEMWQNTLKMIPILKEKIIWRTRLAMVGCSEDNTANFQICQEQNYVTSCGCRGAFCSPEFHEKSANVLVREDIRQKLIFEQDQAHFFLYLSHFRKRCFNTYRRDKYIEECAISKMIQSGIDFETINLQIDELLQDCATKVSETDLYKSLLQDRNSFRNYNQFPLMLLNKEEISFKNEKEMQAKICRRLSIEKEEGCVQIIGVTTVTSESNGPLFYILLILGLVAIGALVVICYKNVLRKEMNKEIKMQVSTAVEHYFTLSETKPES